MNLRTMVIILLVAFLHSNSKFSTVDARKLCSILRSKFISGSPKIDPNNIKHNGSPNDNGYSGNPHNNGPSEAQEKSKNSECQESSPAEIYETLLTRARVDARKYALTTVHISTLNKLEPYFKKVHGAKLGEGNIATIEKVESVFDGSATYAMKVDTFRRQQEMQFAQRAEQIPPSKRPKPTYYPDIPNLAYEADVMLQLQDLNSIYFPKLITYGSCGRYEAIVMELLDKSLHDVYDPEKPISHDVATILLLFLMEATSEMQKKNFLHRDIKLRNVMFAKRIVNRIPTYRLNLVDFKTAIEDKYTVPYREIDCGPLDLMPASTRKDALHSKKTDMLTVMNIGILMLAGARKGPVELMDKKQFEKTIKKSKPGLVDTQFGEKSVKFEEPIRCCYQNLLKTKDAKLASVVENCKTLLRANRTEEVMRQTLLDAFPQLQAA